MGFVHEVEQLRRWSAKKLQSAILRCRGRERTETATLIAHLSEVDRRELHSRWGYSSLFVYCTDELGHSEAEAYLRIQVARVSRRHPEVLDRLANGTLSLSVAAVISPVLTLENAGAILARANGMTKLQAKELVVEFRPRALVRSGVRRKPQSSREAVIHQRVPDESVSGDTALQNTATSLFLDEDPSATVVEAVGTGSSSEATGRPKAEIEPAQADAYNFRFSADRALKDKIERLGEVLGVMDPFAALEKIVAAAVDVALDQKDPERRHERRVKRQRAKEAADAQPEPQPTQSVAGVSGSSKRRAIPAAVRDRVLQRAEYRCEHRSGIRRCAERTRLEIDHRVPHGKGGSDGESNLQVLCSSHNRWKAKQDYGREYVESKIAQSRITQSLEADSEATHYAVSQSTTRGASQVSERASAYRAAGRTLDGSFRGERLRSDGVGALLGWRFAHGETRGAGIGARSRSGTLEATCPVPIELVARWGGLRRVGGGAAEAPG